MAEFGFSKAWLQTEDGKRIELGDAITLPMPFNPSPVSISFVVDPIEWLFPVVADPPVQLKLIGKECEDG